MRIQYDILGQNIQHYRRAKKITQEEMAEELNLSVSFISQLERGISKVSLDTLCSICDFLECPLNDLLNYSQEETPVMFDFIDTYKKLSEKEQRLFYYMLKVYQEHSKD